METDLNLSIMASANAVKLVFSVSAFSAIVALSTTYSSFLVPLLYDLYFSAFHKQTLFGSALEKYFAFVICNGLLVIIFKNSGLIDNISPKTPVCVTTNDTLGVTETTAAKSERALELHVVSEVYQDEEVEVEEELGGSAEEFNKKCEDFIRRVKEEIKLGGR